MRSCLLGAVAIFSLAALAGPAVPWDAKWIAAQPDGETPETRMPIFRRAFRLNKPVERATIDISGLGQYELTINGRKIGKAELAPGWTNYRKTIFYNTFDVTAALQQGDNVLGVMLGNGFFHVPKISGRYTKLTESFGQPKLTARLRVTLRGGEVLEIPTDGRWKRRAGPIVFSHVYGGEDYDARLEESGWNQPGIDDSQWAAALEVPGPGGRLVEQTSPEIRVMQVFHPAKVTEPRAGVHVYDLGQNFAGWPAITVQGNAGATVKLIPGELLRPDGLVSQVSSGSPQWFSYTLKGSGPESWSPRFSYYGFRYVQVEGEGVTVTDMEGRFVHSSAPRVGEFACSKPMFNQIHELIIAAVRSNMMSVLTDCPHREKLGWLEQSYLSGSGIMYNYGVQRLYGKIADDMAESQTAGGLIPDIAPEFTVFDKGFRDSPEWGSAVVLSPWLTYKHFGNLEILASHYDSMKRYVEYLSGKSTAGILQYGLGDWYDIGPKAPGNSQLTSMGVTGTAIFCADLAAMRDIARLLGKSGDAVRFERMEVDTRAVFLAKFYHADSGVYDQGSQTVYGMTLSLGIVPAEGRADALKRLVEDIRSHGNHTTAGDIGFHFVLQALSEGGRSDVIYDMLANPEAPSYAAQLASGATTLTEAWDANPKSSQNHFMLGHAEEWFYRYLAGIDVDYSRRPAERIVLRPTPVGDIESAHAKCRTPAGEVSSQWQVRDGHFVYDVEIPAKVTARMLLPGKPPQQIGPGRHHFEIAYPLPKSAAGAR